MQGIYCIKNLITNKSYIGQANNIVQRWNRHKSDLNKQIHHNNHLQRAWNKYGEQNFEFEIIEIVENCDYLQDKEAYWIKHFKSIDRKFGYNIREAGINSPISEETKLKISKANTGRKFSKEHKEKLSIAGKKRVLSDETKLKISKALIGKKHSKEFCRKISDALKGRQLSEKHKDKISKVQSKLSEKDVIDILTRAQNGETVNSISKDYGDRNRITRIILNVSYKYVNRDNFPNAKINKEVITQGKGDKNPNSKITEKQAKEVIQLLTQGVSMVQVRETTGISYSIIRKIKDGVTWTYLTGGKIKNK